jgi:hypothetical protein
MIFMENCDNCEKHLLEVTGGIENGRQYDLDINLPEDNRDVVFGSLKDAYGDPIHDAVIKLIEIVKNKDGEFERKPVSHTFTNKSGEFVFGPLCPKKHYTIDIWVNRVDHIKICKTCEKKGSCLKGVNIDCDKHPEAPHTEAEAEFKAEFDINAKD